MDPNWPSILYGFVRSRQLENTYDLGPEVGVWLITALRISCGWGAVPEKDWPYETRNWPPAEPPGLDLIAKQYRELCYRRVRSVNEGRMLLVLQERPFRAALEITEQWYDAKDGVIEDSENAKIVGNHCVPIVGYDDRRKAFHFRNSWGANWGDKGYGWLSYKYFRSHILEAWVSLGSYSELTRARETMTDHPKETGWFAVDRYDIDSYIDGKLTILDILDFASEERIGWCFAFARKGRLDVEELFVRPAYRNMGHGKRLVQALSGISLQLGLPLRFWVSHCDSQPWNLKVLNSLVNPLGLTVKPSGVRWAAYKAEAGKKRTESVTIREPRINHGQH